MRQNEPLPGTRVLIPLVADPARPEDRAEVRVVAAPRRDLVRNGGPLSAPLRPAADALLVDVRVGGRTVIPGAWVQREVMERGEPIAPRSVTEQDLRPPAVIVGDSPEAVLHWGETVWPLPLGPTLAIPASARLSPHPLSRLRRLALVAAGRRAEVGLTLWRDPAFEIPWHDVRMLPHASWWFDSAQVPAGMRYADAEAAQGVGRARRL
ncbi:hypothetical protein ACXET9_04730 [Brachybacterium sp. DNPG3]